MYLCDLNLKMKFRLFCVGLLILLEVHEGSLGEYGESCENVENCKPKDYREHLICYKPSSTLGFDSFDESNTETYNSKVKPRFAKSESNFKSSGICTCPLDMIRDVELDRCVSPPFGACDSLDNPQVPRKTCSRFALCFPQANKGVCFCESDAALNNATEQCKLSYGSNRCENPSDCDTHNFLTCSNNTCICMLKDLQKWNPTENKCGFVVGASCIKIDPFPDPVCVENAECINGKCSCLENYSETSTKDCKLSYKQACERDSDCHPDFQCSKNTCLCPESQIYFESTGKCHLPQGASCDLHTDVCTLQAECQNGTCNCVSGFEPSHDARCQGSYGSYCSEEEEVLCHTDFYLSKCNHTIGTCDCKENYKYDNASGNCVGNLQEECKFDQDCIEHAICHEGKCTCGGDLIPDLGNKACFVGYGKSCNNFDCDPNLFLKCDEQRLCTCASPGDQTYDIVKKSCVALVGRHCAASADDGIECVWNSTCAIDPEDSTLTKCKCLIGYSANATGFCVLNFSASNNVKSWWGFTWFVIIFLSFL